MKRTTILCPLADRRVTVEVKRTADGIRSLVRCLAPCTGRYCPSRRKPKKS